MSSQTDTIPEKTSTLAWRLEPRTYIPAWLPALTSAGAVVAALAIGAVILALAGGDPIAAYAQIARSSFGGLDVFSDTLVKAIPLMLVGMACAIAFRMRLWNIGAEGQFFLGAWGASAVVLAPLLPPDTSGWIFIPTMMLAGMAAGALYALLPGFLKARFKVNEIISTLMLNYIAIAWNNFFSFAVWSEGGFQMSRTFPRSAWLPRLADFAGYVDAFSGLTTHLGLLFALIAAVLVWWVLNRSRWGYEIRLIGDNPRAA